MDEFPHANSEKVYSTKYEGERDRETVERERERERERVLARSMLWALREREREEGGRGFVDEFLHANSREL